MSSHYNIWIYITPINTQSSYENCKTCPKVKIVVIPPNIFIIFYRNIPEIDIQLCARLSWFSQEEFKTVKHIYIIWLLIYYSCPPTSIQKLSNEIYVISHLSLHKFLQEGYNWKIQATSASENCVILNRLHIVACKKTATFCVSGVENNRSRINIKSASSIASAVFNIRVLNGKYFIRSSQKC
jgi:hypothetical protein